MPYPFLRRLLGRGKPRQTSPTTLATTDALDGHQQDSEAEASSLFAFVDLKDPFATAEIAAEGLPGPVLSIMSAKKFDSLFLFHTPHTRQNAVSTVEEISCRYPKCRVTVCELPVSDPKDYSSLMGGLCRELRDLGRSPSSGFLFVSPGVIASVKGLRTEDLYVCVSSGTAEMRAAWFLLTALGMLRAKLLQVGSPAYPLFGDANVREVQMDTTDWATIRQLVMPSQYFGDRVTTPPTLPRLGSNRGRLKQATTNDPKLQELLTGAHPLPTSKDANLAETGTFQVPGCVSEERFTSLVPGLDEALQEMGIYVGSATLRHAAERAGIAAGSHLPVLLLGETGTGKERFAHLIHRLSPRCRNDVVAINCAAIPKELAESYLFGHMKGAFTGAISDKKGMFEHADQSTLFLDEIAELTLEVQAKLLRVIQDGAVHRVGSMTPRKADVRIIAATNRDLRNEVAAGRFR